MLSAQYTSSWGISGASPGADRCRSVARAGRRREHVISRDFLCRNSRRDVVLGLGLTLPMLLGVESVSADPSATMASARFPTPDYSQQGPLQVLKLPRLKHIYTSCSTSADRCTLKISAWVPQGGSSVRLKAPFPLVVITPGFLIGSDQYNSYAERLASWGYAVVSYDFTQQVLDPTTDIACVKLLKELIDWCSTSGNVLSKVSDPENVMLIGHSRGGKISTLAAINDKRVKSLFLLDPVDVTVYTPDDRINYPSATVALAASPTRQQLPVCVVGAGRGGDCAPVESSFDLFYKAARGPAWKAVVEEAGHLQFLDQRATTAMGAFCQAGTSMDEDVKDIARLMMVAWAETSMHRRDGARIGVDSSGEWVTRIATGRGDDDGRGEGRNVVEKELREDTADGPGRVQVDVEDVIDSVFATIKESPIPAMFEYKNMRAT